jgi:biopolymer transport protein ExbB/TolQ
MMPIWLFLKGLSPKTWIIIGIVAAALIALKVYGDAKYEKGMKDMSKKLEEVKKEEWAKKDQELAALKAEALDKIAAVEQERKDLNQERINMYQALDANVRSLRNERNRGYEEAYATPDDIIWGRIRTVSGQLAAQRSADSR